MSALDSRQLDGGLKDVIKTIVWGLFDEIKTESITVRISILRIPISISISISSLEGIIERLVGAR